jgi:hypothetical protein
VVAAWTLLLALLIGCAPRAEYAVQPSVPRSSGESTGLLTPSEHALLAPLLDDALHAVVPEAESQALVAHNPHHDLQLRFTPGGVQVTSLRPAAPGCSTSAWSAPAAPTSRRRPSRSSQWLTAEQSSTDGPG